MAGLGAAGAVLEARLASFVKDNRLPGAAAGVVHGNALAWSCEVGFADTSARRPTQPGTLYRIASITKTFTATAVMQLRDAGRLDLDDPAVVYLPELRSAVSPFAPIEAVTIRRMLSHESGLASNPPGADWSVPVYQGDPELTLARASDIVITLAPNVQYKYSNLAYQLLGEIVTRVSGLAYPRYLRESILDPLGMSATSFEPLAGELADRRATGYDWRALSDELDPAPAMSAIWAEAGLWSCLGDLAAWVSFQLRAYQNPAADSPVLAAATLREMHRPRYLADDAWTQAQGICWSGARQDDVIWIQDSGFLRGFSATACFDPRTQVGAIVLLNNGTDDIVGLARDLASIARHQVLTAPPVIEVSAPTPGQYRPLLGIYTRPDMRGRVLRLEWRGGNLVLFVPEAAWSMTLTPTSDPDVFVTGPESALPGENVRFQRLADGRVASVLVMDSTLVRLERVAASR